MLTAGATGLLSQSKITYGDFLKRPKRAMIANMTKKESGTFSFNLYLFMYSPDLQKNNRGDDAYRVSNHPALIPKMLRYCCLFEIL